MTRRILQGGEDYYPSDLGGDRSSSFHFSGGFTIPQDSSITSYNGFFGIWTPPLRPMIVQGMMVIPGSTSTNAPTTPPDLYLEAGIGDPASDESDTGVDVPFFHYTIANSHWVNKGGGAGFSFAGGYEFVIHNGFSNSSFSPGNGGTAGSGNYTGWINGPAGFTNGGYYFDPSQGGSTDNAFRIYAEMYNGQTGTYSIYNWSWDVVMWGFYL